MSLVTSFPTTPSLNGEGHLNPVNPETKPRPRAAKSSPKRPAPRARTKKRSSPKALDVQVLFPAAGRIRFHSESMFSDTRSELVQQFLERAFLAPEVDRVEIDARRWKAEIYFRADEASNRALIKKISQFLANGPSSLDPSEPVVLPTEFSEPDAKVRRLARYGNRLSGWTVKHEVEGRIRLYNPALFRRRELCQAIERELMNAFGVERYFTSEITSTVLIYYDYKHIQKHQLVEILDEVIRDSKEIGKSPVDLDLPVCTVSVGPRRPPGSCIRR